MLEKTQALIILAFIISNILGIAAALQLISSGSVQETYFASAEPSSSINLFLAVLATTAIILVLYRLKAQLLIKIWFLSAIFITNFLFFYAFVDFLIALLIATASLLLFTRIKDFYVQNGIKIISFSGAGAALGSAFGFLPSALLLGLISLYDAISVHLTKHMVSLAKKSLSSENFMGVVFLKEGANFNSFKLEKSAEGKMAHVRALGGGDIIIPMIFIIAVMKEFGIFAALMSFFGAICSLYLLMDKIGMNKEGKAYPAMQFLSIGLCLGLLVFFAFPF